jgi:hypothetical protein
MSFDFRYRRFSLRRLRISDLINAGGGRLLTFLAGGAVFFALIELGPLVALGLIFGLIPLGALIVLIGKRIENRGDRPADTISTGLNWLEPATVPFGPSQRMLNSTLAAANVMPGGSPMAVSPRYFMDPLVATRGETGIINAPRSGPDAFVGYTLRRRFEDALERSRYEDAARIIAEMAETTDNQAWCVNANRRLAYRRSRVPENSAALNH